MSKHTPGPWKAVRSVVIAESVPYSNSRSNHVCRTDGLDASGEEENANARLIAAAPEMLEALKELDDACCGNLDVYENRLVLRKALILARAAIAKAEGGV